MAKYKKRACGRSAANITVYINGDNNGIIVISNTGIGNSGYIGQIEAPININNNLSAQERDLLQIYRKASGRKQIEIMQFMYGKE